MARHFIAAFTLNPNQVRAHGLNVFDNPFNDDEFGIDGHDAFIPFDTTGTVVHFDSRVPTAWEKTHRPIICITGNTWDPSSELTNQGKQSREQNELRTIRSLTSGMNQRQIAVVRISEENSRIVRNSQIESELGRISSAYNEREFCERLIASVKIATAYRKDIDEWEEKRKAASVISNDRFESHP